MAIHIERRSDDVRVVIIDRPDRRNAIDATRKLAGEGHPRTWPDELRMDSATIENVTRRWAEYGL